MKDEGNVFLKTLRGEKISRRPFWFMRQAGRFLPEFREVRKKAGGFLDLCFNTNLAAEVTLQPIKRFGMDAAIIFSDILVVPYAMGVDVKFIEGFGPDIPPFEDLEKLSLFDKARLEKSYAAMTLVRRELANDKVLIGFSGAPFTVSCYMVDGSSKNDFARTKKYFESDRNTFLKLLDALTEATTQHLVSQIEAGVEVAQIFDSWAGLIENDRDYEEFIILPTKKITSAIKRKYPEIFVIGFPRCSGKRYAKYAEKTGVDVVGIDETVDVKWAAATFPKNVAIQGNLSSQIFAESKETAVEETLKILFALKSRKHIFNLGHGVVPETPIENAMAVAETVKSFAL